MAWSQEARHLAAATGLKAALVMGRPADIANAIIAELTHSGFKLPAFSTVERITKHARALAHRKICLTVHRRLGIAERQALDQLLTIPLDQRRTAFQAIKRLPQRPSRKHLQESVEHLEWLESLDSIATDLKHVAPALILDFAHQARTADASDLKEFAPAKRYTLLLSLMQNAKARARDTVAGTVVKRIGTSGESSDSPVADSSNGPMARAAALACQSAPRRWRSASCSGNAFNAPISARADFFFV